MNTVKGKVAKKLAVESGVSKAGKEWRKQSLVVNTGDDYNPEVCISFFGDEKIAILDTLSEGQEVEVSVNISSRAWQDKYFHSIDGWKVDVVGAAAPSGTMVTSDDLPF
tara:strand:- start:1127 stop:1453 length:327 start_codon:yes stop_codon:yes gene_type:complete